MVEYFKLQYNIQQVLVTDEPEIYVSKKYASPADLLFQEPSVVIAPRKESLMPEGIEGIESRIGTLDKGSSNIEEPESGYDDTHSSKYISILIIKTLLIDRIYVFDVSKQSKTITNRIANVKIEFNFVSPVPIAANATVTVYYMSLYDRIWSLKRDGTKQYIIK